MFRYSTITRELALNLTKVIFTLKHSGKLRRYLLCGCVAACHGMECVVCCAECDCTVFKVLAFVNLLCHPATTSAHSNSLSVSSPNNSSILTSLDEIMLISVQITSFSFLTHGYKQNRI